ncbi:MAG: hypothetical protein Q8Q42_00935 [Nanoarchaeota archaeon]|nr:hypothetical protein [Nanoarchaeota archaeon]
MLKKRGVITVILLVALMLVLQGCTVNSSSKYPQETIDKLAQCLTDNDVIMYGAFWCPHCTNTKKKFGSSFGYVNYVECDPRCKPDENGKIMRACGGYEGQPELCLEREIEAYDTWTFPDGTRLVGEPSLESLDQKSGCNILPKGEE